MFFPALIRMLSRFFDIRPGEAYRVGVTVSLLFFLIAANNLTKIVRDSLFLGYHLVSELPYVYILVAVVAGTVIATYSRYTTTLSLTRLILTSNATIILTLVFFWFLITFFNPGWGHYAFYVFSAMVGLIAVAQFWTFTHRIFTSPEGERLFGLLTAGGTVGGIAAGFGAKSLLAHSLGINHLLWVIAGLFLAASAVVLWADRWLRGRYPDKELELSSKQRDERAGSIGELIGGSRYLKTIAMLIFLSVIVSTLIDFQFKAAAKQAYLSREALAVFFSSYYAWLSVATFFVQVVLTGRILGAFGLIPSLYLTPGVLLSGSVAIFVWPGLIAATATRMADAALRNSLHRSCMELLYMPVPAAVKKTVKTFLDVVVERTGDATAGFIILFYSLSSMTSYIPYVHFICVALILVWFSVIPIARLGHLETSRRKAGGRGLAVK